VADSGNHKIRKITQGEVTTFAGSSIGDADGKGTAARFNNPSGIAVDSSGNIFVADSRNNKIRKITSQGEVDTFAGDVASGDADGKGTAARFNNPYGIAVDSSGNIFVADVYNNKVRKITSQGVVTTLAGSSKGFVNGKGTTAQFENPVGIAVDTDGNILVADFINHKIRKIIIK
jgi:DNA-binding beta-propeller fold protein YncE